MEGPTDAMAGHPIWVNLRYAAIAPVSFFFIYSSSGNTLLLLSFHVLASSFRF
jgi:hypothetical protein